MSDLSAKNPQYINKLSVWEQTVHCYDGEQTIKSKGDTYLPATSGQIADGYGGNDLNAVGNKSYEAYKKRSVFPDIFKDAVNAAIGIMHRKDPVIELPSQMEPLLENATIHGDSLNLLLRKINYHQLITGRVGLLTDLPENAPSDVLPYIAVYDATSIVNWDDGSIDNPSLQNLNLVVLNESENERKNNFEWEYIEKYRVLVLGDTNLNEGKFANAIYQQGVFEEKLGFDESKLIVPRFRGTPLEQIPFTFINTLDLLTEPDNPPFLGLSNLCLSIYRGEADYRQSLFMQGQDTLVTIGAALDENDTVKVGSTGRLDLPKGGDAKYVGVSSSGLQEQREALRNDRNDARELAGKILDNRGSNKEAEGTVKIRVAANTATLVQIAKAGAEGLQNQLRTIATWMGANPDDVVVTPNIDFSIEPMKGRDLIDLIQAKNQGAPISNETIHDVMKKTELTSMNYEDEVDKILDENPLSNVNLSQTRVTEEDLDGEKEFGDIE